MSDVKWIKIVTDIFDDEKILLIETLPEADSIIVIWFKLLCLAGKQNNSGVFTLNGKIPYTDKMFSTIFRRKESIIQLALQTFINFGMIEIIENTIVIPNWGKHQTLDKIESRNEYMRNYMVQYRSKQISKVNSKVNSILNVNSAELDSKEVDNKEEDSKEIDRKELENIKTKKRKITIPPSIKDVKDYCDERQNGIDPQHFIDYNETRGWFVGKSKMKDWKAAIRTWEKNQKDKSDKSNDWRNF